MLSPVFTAMCTHEKKTTQRIGNTGENKMERNFGIEMEKSDVVCSYSAKNNQCIGKRCPFSKANAGNNQTV